MAEWIKKTEPFKICTWGEGNLKVESFMRQTEGFVRKRQINHPVDSKYEIVECLCYKNINAGNDIGLIPILQDVFYQYINI
jgi:hypothetical protein